MTNTPTIYLCDDDNGVRGGLSYLLEQCGFNVNAFASGPALLAALDALPQPPRGVFVLDLQMEPMRGDAVHDRLHARGLGHRMPVIFLSAHGTIPITVSAMKKGAITFVEKPYTVETLVPLLKEALEKEEQWQRQANRCEFLRTMWESLAPQQRRVARMKAKGDITKVIGDRIDLADRTVEEHWVNVRDKLGVDSVAALATTIAEMRACGVDISTTDRE